ncbi:MAG: SDR family NAD(P)-dependent oxidoreductase [Chloroflexota bacterium]
MANGQFRRLNDKVAIVTGSSRGIGRGIAERLAAEGAKVVVNSRHQADVEEAAEALRTKGAEALAVAGDVGKREDVDHLFGEALRAFGTVDILVNNAGWADPFRHFLETTEDFWDDVIRTDLKSVYLCSHRMANLLVDQRKAGAMVNISSFAAARSHRDLAAYDASKGGIEAFSRAIALDLAPFGIRVNVVGPGAIHTEKHDKAGPEAQIKRGSVVPLGRVGFPEDIAAAVAFLVSDDASYITGQTVYVDGGMLAQLRAPQVDRSLPASVAARVWRQPPPPRPIRSWE